ncbi:MAG: protoheme IX farnesyltransferase [Deltaproteobacteria bacterium]|nr:protoheme IX farnesyltransferase [Deltaproteobacteria bacterium]MBW2398344.1 protoheme IX farnesyltransferase [Deltaproteobacteria bacterium]MBW2665091.1 protoheme IX farnesyltransferase [Deltaproteobacteria bacterium]
MATAALSVLRDYVDLTKPRLLPLVLMTGLPVLGMSAGGWPSAAFTVVTLLGIALAAAAANTLNAYLERDLDARMERTRSRPVPAGLIEPRAALIFGLVLGVVSTVVLYAVGGVPTAGLGVASILFYVFVYTLWLKPRTSWNTVVGGAAGAVAPLIADAAVNGQIGAAGLSLFGIIFFWQPPHVWAIALYRKADYAAADIKMLPNVIGDEATRRRMLWYTLGLVPVTLAPVALGLLGNIYLAVALGANAWFIWSSVQVLRQRTDDAARRMFRVSLAYLFSLFAAMLVELLLRG